VATTRFSQLDSMRAYAAALLAENGETGAASQRHAAHVTIRKDEYVTWGEGPGERDAVLGLDDLWSDLRAAVNWAITSGRRNEAHRLIAGLGAHAMLREKPEVGEWADAAIELEGDDDVLLPEVLAAAAMVHWTLGQREQGMARSARAADLARAAGRLSTDVVVAEVLNGGFRDGFAARCLRLADEAGAAGTTHARAWALNGAGMAHAYEGRFAAALDVLSEARRIANDVGAPSVVALCEMARTIALLDDDPQAALAAADESLAQAGSVGSTWLFGATPNYRAAALVRAGNIDAAVDEVLITLRRLGIGGTPQSVANAVRNSIALLDRLGQPASCAPLVRWLEAHPGGIVGTPGMRRHVIEMSERLERAPLSDAERAAARDAAQLSMPEIAAQAVLILERATA
jgi:tetratricopeptide (TPR) repeat protein